MYQEICHLAQRVLQKYNKKHPQDVLQGELEKGVTLQPVAPVTVVARWVELLNLNNRLVGAEEPPLPSASRAFHLFQTIVWAEELYPTSHHLQRCYWLKRHSLFQFSLEDILRVLFVVLLRHTLS